MYINSIQFNSIRVVLFSIIKKKKRETEQRERERDNTAWQVVIKKGTA